MPCHAMRLTRISHQPRYARLVRCPRFGLTRKDAVDDRSTMGRFCFIWVVIDYGLLDCRRFDDTMTRQPDA
ncbi:hypothetical protein BJX96DRAFT_158028 [Aspergillus floccosus]